MFTSKRSAWKPNFGSTHGLAPSTCGLTNHPFHCVMKSESICYDLVYMFVAILEEIDRGLFFQALQTQTHFWAEGGPKRILLLKAQSRYFSRTLSLIYYSLCYKIKHQLHQVLQIKFELILLDKCCNLVSVMTQIWSNSLEQFL